jgi:hypothetical protein
VSHTRLVSLKDPSFEIEVFTYVTVAICDASLIRQRELSRTLTSVICQCYWEQAEEFELVILIAHSSTNYLDRKTRLSQSVRNT